MAPLRALQLLTGFTRSGAELQALMLANCLEGPDCHFVLCAREDGPTRADAGSAETLVLPKSRTVDSAYLRALVGVIRRNKVQIIHSHLFGNNLYGYLAARLTGCPIIQTVHGWDSIASRRRVLAYRLMARRVARIVTVTEALETAFRRRTRILNGRVTTIRNGIFVERYGRPAPHALRSAFGLEGSGPVIGVIGNIKPIKGIDILLHAVPAIRASHPGLNVLIVGDTIPWLTGYRQQMDQLVSMLGLGGCVRFLGAMADIAAFLSLLDVFVLPSRSEGLPLSLLEAMAARRPIVATAVGGVPQVLSDGVTGLLVPPEEPGSLTRAILDILNDPKWGTSLGEMARSVVEERFHANAMAARYLALYRDAAGVGDDDGC